MMKARDFAQREFECGTPFSTMAMSMALVPLLSFNSSGTFCSKLCADILKAAGILEDGICTNKMSPSALYRITSNTACARAKQTKYTGTIAPIGFK
tara:strand:+ start:9071 stop:9358 length:288 start_codon:yes stop_codon:yes gene_type:complete